MLDSYTTCNVWLTFCIVVKGVQWSCTLKIPWKNKNLYYRNMLLYIPSNKKQYSCKGNFNLWKQCNTCFNEVWPHYHFFSMAFAFNKGISLLQKELQWREDNSWNRKHDSCKHTTFEQIQDILDEMKPHHYFPVKHVPSKEGFHFLKMMFIFFYCFNHMEGILHTCSHISFQNKYTSTSYFFVLLQNVSIN